MSHDQKFSSEKPIEQIWEILTPWHQAKSKAESSISEAVEKAATSGMLDIQNELEKCTEERNDVADVNQKLIKNHEMWREKVKEAKEREVASMKSMNEWVLDLEEHVLQLPSSILCIVWGNRRMSRKTVKKAKGPSTYEQCMLIR
ncbi:unnamed protein product [Vicia faba]|uniref:Uncharacterized protein n=1 Tax=Vicia faba TaxID=3906 RepID=A0AAV0ZPG0_VICFA|nr:unnamed protein product [Vicia faba]